MKDFHQILMMCEELAREHPGHVFIGGVAVYLHAVNCPLIVGEVEASHDADLMIALQDFAELRQTDELTANRRLNKHQLIRDGVEFDVYVERQNGLAIPYDEATAHAVEYDGLRVACLEHLLVLKLNAFISREHSAKGQKDARDLVTIAAVSELVVKESLLGPYLRENHVEALDRVLASPVFTYLAEGNAHQAKRLRAMFAKFVKTIKACL